MAQKDMVSARERRIRRAAAHKGLSVRMMRSGHDRDRYVILNPAFGGHMRSHNPTFPASFSLEEAEAYLAD